MTIKTIILQKRIRNKEGKNFIKGDYREFKRRKDGKKSDF